LQGFSEQLFSDVRAAFRVPGYPHSVDTVFVENARFQQCHRAVVGADRVVHAASERHHVVDARFARTAGNEIVKLGRACNRPGGEVGGGYKTLGPQASRRLDGLSVV